MTTSEILKEGESRMQGVIAATKKSFAAVRTGRANPALLDRIVVSYYGTPTPLTQMAGVSAPEPRLLVISPWDKNSLKDIDGLFWFQIWASRHQRHSVIRLAIPLTGTGGLGKGVHDEEHRVASGISAANDAVKSWRRMGRFLKTNSRPERKQELTNKYIFEIDNP